MKTYPKYLTQITTSDAMRLFGISDATVLYWINAGFISASEATRGKKMQVKEFSRLEFQMHLFTEAAGKHQRPAEDVVIGDLMLDPEFAVRVKELNLNRVKHYAELLTMGTEPPPVIVAMIDGKKILLGGRHRIAAAKLAGRDQIKAMIIAVCDRAEAFFAARTDNDDHGLPPTNSDRKKTIIAGLLRPEYAKMTVPELAREFRYCERQVQRIRKELLEGKPATKCVSDERTMEQRAVDQLARSIALLEKFRPTLASKLRDVIASEKG